MPFELGIYLGSKWFGNKTQRTKSCLILDREPYRYQKFISDIAGQDIYSHQSNPELAIELVRNWLRTESKRAGIPGKAVIGKRYNKFQRELSTICQRFKLQAEELIFVDLTYIVAEWLEENAS